MPRINSNGCWFDPPDAEGQLLTMQLRTYTLASEAALDEYADVHWPRHIPSLAGFGVTTHGIWRRSDGDEHQLLALVSYADGDDPEEVNRRYMASPEFRADMAGFDRGGMRTVSTVLLTPTGASPLQ